MKIQALNNRRMKIFIGVVAVIVLVGVTVILTTSKAKYRTTQSIPLVRGKINWKPYDFKMMAMYQEGDSGEYTEIETMPSSGYVINEEKSYCYTTSSSEIDTNAKLYTLSSGEHVIANLSKNSKCYLYFDVYLEPITIEEIMANSTISERTDFSVVFTEETTNTLFTASDEDGTSYYYAGAATDNYVSFAGYYWRIIRINGDGSIRLIYDGSSARTNGTSSTDTQISTSAFNPSGDDNMYVGYMYTSGSVHGLGTSSTVKGVLDDWYEKTLASYASYIDNNAGFCGDRTAYLRSGSSPDYVYTEGGGTGTIVTYYADCVRYRGDTSLTPTLKCTNSSDLYTVGTSSKGNKSLIYPIGLINMNEVWMSGGYNVENSSYYLYTGQDYWTMSPSSFTFSNAYVFYVRSNGSFSDTTAGWTYPSVRPVINLKADTKFKSGSLGTMESPYIVEGAE